MAATAAGRDGGDGGGGAASGGGAGGEGGGAARSFAQAVERRPQSTSTHASRPPSRTPRSSVFLATRVVRLAWIPGPMRCGRRAPAVPAEFEPSSSPSGEPDPCSTPGKALRAAAAAVDGKAGEEVLLLGVVDAHDVAPAARGRKARCTRLRAAAREAVALGREARPPLSGDAIHSGRHASQGETSGAATLHRGADSARLC